MAQIYASRGSTNYKPFNAPDDAPLYDYSIAGHNINTKAVKDTTGQEWYLTDGGQWRNAATKQAQAMMPTYAAPAPVAAPAPAPAPAVPGPVNNVNPTDTFKGIQDFLPTAQQNLFQQTPMKSVMDYLPKDWAPSQAYNQAMTQGNQTLDRQLAARGLIGSGAELEARNNLSGQLLGQETDRQMSVANQDSQNTLSETNNLRNLISNMASADYGAYNTQQQNAGDRELARDAQSANVLSIVMDYLKSMNPMQYGFPATNTVAGNQIDLGKALASLAGGSGGGGGGGGSSAPGIAPTYSPAPSSGSGTRDLIGIGTSILPSLIAALNKNT